MSVRMVLSLLFTAGILASVTLALLPQDCQNEGIFLTLQPKDVEIVWGMQKVANFPCKHEGGSFSETQLQWIINSSVYNSSNSQLPPDHQYLHSTHTLIVSNIKQWQNGTTYQCQVVLHKGSLCAVQSSIGRLIIKVFEVQVSPHYRISDNKLEVLTEITTSFTQIEGGSSYNISFIDLVSGKTCDSNIIPASSCADGACTHTFNVLLSACPNNTDIGVTVVTDSGLSTPTKIDAVNNFIKILFQESTSSITLKFINQPRHTEKHYTVRYGTPDPYCQYLPIHTKGHLINSNSITVELFISPEDTTEICLSVIVTNGTKTVTVEGIYGLGSSISDISNAVAAIATLIFVLIIIVSPTVIIVLYCHSTGQTSYGKGIVHVNKLEQDRVILEPIDLSTTFYKLLKVTKECSIYEFGKEHFPDYQPHRGFGYYKHTDDDFKPIQLHKRVIVMSNGVPTHTIISAAIKQQSNIINEHNIYVQETGCRTLHEGDTFLYCARSKVITKMAYWKIFDVTYECKESSFIEEKFSGYNTDWICYGYFELSKPMYIQPTQSFIVMRKDGKLVKGPGVDHLLREKDISAVTQPPNLFEYPKWQHVFVQSNDGDTLLTPGTKYLFCAMMDRIGYSVHRAVYVVDKESSVEEFGRRYNPVFKAQTGYGYYEFTKQEYLKPEKNVIVMDKEGRLFTGAGAKFFFINCKYGKDEIDHKKKISPPDLTGTEWKHVFIQSHSHDRMLTKGSLFLYCEFKTELPI